MCKHTGLYIAYGSNMNIEQMARRCPTAKVVSSGWLEGYKLRFRGGSYGSVATVEPSPDDLVPILIWELKSQDEANLDLYEGYPRLYRKETLTIKLGRKMFPAMIYIMNGEQHPYGYPSQSYFDIIREGYVSAGFDPKLLHQAVAENMKGERIYDTIKKLMNQSIFNKIWIHADSTVTTELNDLYKNLIGPIEKELIKTNTKSAPAEADADSIDELLKSGSKNFLSRV